MAVQLTSGFVYFLGHVASMAHVIVDDICSMAAQGTNTQIYIKIACVFHREPCGFPIFFSVCLVLCS
jgi:hypothetical protein